MAASMRAAFVLGRNINSRSLLLHSNAHQVTTRCYKLRYNRELQALYRIRTRIGPEPERPRSEFINWNYESELYAFNKRLGEDLSDDILKTVFLHKSYVDKERKKREDLGIGAVTSGLDLHHNEELANLGRETASNYIMVYLRNIYPNYFEEGIRSIHDYLMSEEMLSYIGIHLGIPDLMLCSDFPPEKSTIVQNLMAFIGALEQEKGKERAVTFVQDFILPQLIGKDINEMWNLVNPMGLLTAILNFQKRGLPEPRLLCESGSSTIIAVYYVGIYSDKKLIGKAPGETVQIAEEMAARDALKVLLQTQDNRPPLALGKSAKNLNLDGSKVNISAKEFIEQFTPRDNISISSS